MTDYTATLNTKDYPEVTREHLGILPEFFISATQKLSEYATLDHIAQVMDDLYQFGGFQYPFSGEIDPQGVYRAPEDPPLEYLATISYLDRFTMFCYPYAITAIRDNDTGETKIGRFD